MRPFILILLGVAVFGGCRAGNSQLGSVGRTVPPPGTGSFSAPDAYYNRRPATNTATPGAAPRAGTSLGYDDGAVDTLDGGWRSANSNQLPDLRERSTAASFETPVGSGVASSSQGFRDPGSSASSSITNRGMRVNDGTGFAEPSRFTAAAAREIGKSLSPPVIDFNASQGESSTATGGPGGPSASSGSSGLSFRPPSIRRSNVETPTNATYLR